MTTSINEILQYSSINLNTFEVRGIKCGINNAVTTAPVFSRAFPYVPNECVVAVHVDTTAGNGTISNCSFDAYPLMTTSSLRVGDKFVLDTTDYTVQAILNPQGFTLSGTALSTGIDVAATMTLKQREYVIEPDIAYNTSTGTGDFINGDSTVRNINTTGLAAGYFIKSSSYQNYYKIKGIISPTSLGMVSAYQGTTKLGSDYTSKKWLIGQTDIRYSTDDVGYDNQSAKWTYASITDTDITTSTTFLPFADGIELQFNHSLTSTAPDIMDVATVTNKILSQKTTYESPQFSLSVVPYPETMSLKINSVSKDQFPGGNRDYVLNFSQSPIYVAPPPPDQRKIANIMFLKGVSNSPASSVTSEGQWFLTDSSGAAYVNIMPWSESLRLNTVDQTAYKDYVLETNSGLMETIESIIDESVVKYVGTDFNQYVDNGFLVYLNGIKQKVSFPFKSTDDVVFQTSSGTLKPINQDHPGPDEIYEVHYMAAAFDYVTDTITTNAGVTNITTAYFPIQQGSLSIQSSYNDGTTSRSSILVENTDYYISYLTGKIFFITPILYNTSFSIMYMPLSKQVNDLSYRDGTSYCRVYDSRLKVNNESTFEFLFSNALVIINSVLRVYNETRNMDYDISNYNVKSNKLWLEANAYNVSVGLASSDIVIVDYELKSESVEYSPVQINYLTLVGDSKKIYIEGFNVQSKAVPGSLINASLSDSAQNFLSVVESSSFDGTGTLINLNSTIPQDLVNVSLFVSDASVSFVSLPATAIPFIAGSQNIVFKNYNVAHLIRPQSILKINEDCYQVVSATTNLPDTTASLNSGALRDYISASILSSIKISDTPVYNEGETTIYPSRPVVDQMKQAAFIMNNNGSSDILSVISDSSAISIDGTSVFYASNPTLGDVSNAFDSLGISFLSLTTYASSWRSDKIVSLNSTIYSGSNTLAFANNALRYSGMDWSNYTQNGGFLILSNPLIAGDRYSFDYMGRKFLGDTTVRYSFNYFVNLPEKSEVVASFQYQNLDQFYAQVLSQRDFIQNVTQPRMIEEANQLNGNSGQGGQVLGDDLSQPNNGGLSGDYYRKQDAEIETRAFKNIYNFFQDRIENYTLELESGTGLKLFNNDGVLSETQQAGAILPVSRIFPLNYTKMEPRRCNPLTGFFFNTGAKFSNGSNLVINLYGWPSVLTSGCLLGRSDASKYYSINSIVNPNTIQLDATWNETSTGASLGEKYMAAAALPVYDDDGYLGPKHLGNSSQTDGFGLISGDIFTCTIDSSDSTYVFQDPPFPFNLFLPSVSDYNITQIASNLTSGIPGLRVSVENVPDTYQPFGYRTTFVLRTTGSSNYLRLGDSTVMDKLGLVRGAESVGNYDRSAHNPEIYFDRTEMLALLDEQTYLTLMVGETNKLNRLSDLAGASVAIEQQLVNAVQEIPKAYSIYLATGDLIQEPSISTYADASTSHLNALTATLNAILADGSDSSNLNMDWIWPIDYQHRSATITGINGGFAFYLSAPPANDLRILNTVVDSTVSVPVVYFLNDASVVGGTWYDHNPILPVGTYSNDSTVIFAMNTPVVFSLTTGSWVTYATHQVTSTNLNLNWSVDSTPHSTTIPLYPLTYITNIVNQINLTGDITATINPACASFYSSLLVNISSLPANVYFGLRDVFVTYETISDRLLNERISFNNDRYAYLNNTRVPYLEARESQIGSDIVSEELLRNASGDPGNIYVWANNLFNRRQGSYARTAQIQALIDSNQSALNINKTFF